MFQFCETFGRVLYQQNYECNEKNELNQVKIFYLSNTSAIGNIQDGVHFKR